MRKMNESEGLISNSRQIKTGMKMNKNIDARVEETLNSLDGLQKAAATPFFYTRLKASMQNEPNNFWATVTSFITKPVIAFAVVGLVILLNASALFLQNNNSTADVAVTSQTDQANADDYNTTLAANTYYNEK